MELRPLRSGTRAWYTTDAELKAAVDELDDKGLSLGEIHRAIISAFTTERAPGRSTLHRYMQLRRQNGVQVGFLVNLKQAEGAWLSGRKAAAIGYLERALDAAWNEAEYTPDS